MIAIETNIAEILATDGITPFLKEFRALLVNKITFQKEKRELQNKIKRKRAEILKEPSKAKLKRKFTTKKEFSWS
jgi:hypothetical protein